MGGSSKSSPPPPPPPAPPAATVRQEENVLRRNMRDAALRRAGRAATMLAQTEGTGGPRTGTKSLLGE